MDPPTRILHQPVSRPKTLQEKLKTLAEHILACQSESLCAGVVHQGRIVAYTEYRTASPLSCTQQHSAVYPERLSSTEILQLLPNIKAVCNHEQHRHGAWRALKCLLHQLLQIILWLAGTTRNFTLADHNLPIEIDEFSESIPFKAVVVEVIDAAVQSV